MKVRRIDFSPDEWLAGTVELSNADRGVYITICALIYSRGEDIDEELVFHHCQDHGNAVKASLNHLEKLGKIARNGREITQKRCANELETARKRSEKASENGRLGNEIKALKNAGRAGAADASRPRIHQPSTINHHIVSTDVDTYPPPPAARAPEGRAAAPDEDIEEEGAVLLGERKRGLIRKMRVKHGAETVRAALAAVVRRQPAEPVPYFLSCCEEHRPGPDPPAAPRDSGPQGPPPKVYVPLEG